MGEFKERTAEINRSIDKMSGAVDAYMDILFSPLEEGALMRAEERLRKHKTVCRVIRIIVLAVCAVIIYFHLKG